jgi:hypothetical protein
MWQPIETAPKDTYVDIWVVPILGDGEGFRFADCILYIDPDGDRDFIIGALTNEAKLVGNDLLCAITHWMPLPEPPLAQGK